MSTSAQGRAPAGVYHVHGGVLSVTQRAQTGETESSQPRVRLLDLDPEIGSLLAPEEREAAALLTLPVRAVGRDARDFLDHLAETHAFGAILIDGVLAHEVALAGRVALRLLGPGDTVVVPGGPGPLALSGSVWFPTDRLRVALLDAHCVSALGRWPALMVGLYMRIGQQVERLTTQLLISQLPRVEDRLLALMWLMSESWGRVTPVGTRLPLDLTHEALGRMIGARRPTVSLALRDLAEQGALIRQRGGWMLLTPFPLPDPADASTEATIGLGGGAGPMVLRENWKGSPATGHLHQPTDVSASLTALHDTVVRLRERHLAEVARFAERLERLSSTRERCEETRLRSRRRRGQS